VVFKISFNMEFVIDAINVIIFALKHP